MPTSNTGSQNRTNPRLLKNRGIHLNKPQGAIALIGLLLVVFTGLFPPWTEVLHYHSTLLIKQSKGYAPLLAPPEPQEGAWASGDAYKVIIDTSRLLIQWGVILTATGIGVFTFSRQAERREDKKIEAAPKDEAGH